MLDDRHHIFANKQFTTSQREQAAAHVRQLVEGVKPLLSGQFCSRAAVSGVVTMHASEVTTIGQLDVHFLYVMMFPVELIYLFLDTARLARGELWRHADFLNGPQIGGRRRRTHV